MKQGQGPRVERPNIIEREKIIDEKQWEALTGSLIEQVNITNCDIIAMSLHANREFHFIILAHL